jgi:hypothetical protein
MFFRTFPGPIEVIASHVAIWNLAEIGAAHQNVRIKIRGRIDDFSPRW